MLVEAHSDVRAFALAVARVVRDPALWHTASKGAISHVERHFSEHLLQSDVVSLLQQAARYRADSV